MLITGADLITQSVNQYNQIFASYFKQFLDWGQWLFYSFSVIAIVWLCIWQAFNPQTIAESMPGFLKEFFLIAFFYTIMMNALPWLSSVVNSTQIMGVELSGLQVDPASIIQQGITIANNILAPAKNSGVINLSSGALIIVVSYLIILGAFIVVAIELSLVVVLITFLISLSGLILAFGTWFYTRTIARKILDRVLAHSFQLLTLDAVIAAGTGLINQIALYVQPGTVDSFDSCAWTTSAALLFALISKSLPRKVKKIFLETFLDSQSFNISGLSSLEHPIAESKLMVASTPHHPITHMPAVFNQYSYSSFAHEALVKERSAKNINEHNIKTMSDYFSSSNNTQQNTQNYETMTVSRDKAQNKPADNKHTENEKIQQQTVTDSSISSPKSVTSVSQGLAAKTTNEGFEISKPRIKPFISRGKS